MGPNLSSKVVSSHSPHLAALAVDAVLRVIDTSSASNVDLEDVRVVKRLGGTVSDTELVEGLVFAQKASNAAGGPTNMKDARIGCAIPTSPTRKPLVRIAGAHLHPGFYFSNLRSRRGRRNCLP